MLRDSEAEIDLLRERLEKAENAEAAMRRRSLELDGREQSIDLELQRRLDPLKESMARELNAKAQEGAVIEIQRRETEISRLREQIGKLSAPSASSESTGESLEVVLRAVLGQNCPIDLVVDVPKGQKGADLIQTVCNAAQVSCGRIVWEAKNTKSWDKAWIFKTKQAQRESDADVAVIVSAVLPDGIRYLGQVDNVWICSPAAAGGLAILLRHMILRVATAKVISETREARLQALLDYVNSNHFRLACENVIILVRHMEEQLEAERKQLTRAWEKRRQYISSLGLQVVEVIGSLEGAVRRDLIEQYEPDPEEADHT